MKEEHDNYLCTKYNKIFKDRYASMQNTCMVWGFEHGDGWFTIIDKLCSQIQGHIDWSRKARAGNLRFNRALSRALRGDMNPLARYYSYGSDEITDRGLKLANDVLKTAEYRKVGTAVPQVVATQVKEKFGTLRFYYDGGDAFIAGLVSMATSMTAVTCEECGVPGLQRGGGWIRTLCDEHAKDRKQ